MTRPSQTTDTPESVALTAAEMAIARWVKENEFELYRALEKGTKCLAAADELRALMDEWDRASDAVVARMRERVA